MGFQTVEWTSYNRLSCTNCAPTDVILVLKDSTKVAQKACPLDPLVAPETTEDTDFGFRTVEAQLVTAGRLKNQCNETFYVYSFKYDDALLVPASIILASDIVAVVCRGGLTTYIDEKVGDDIKLELAPGADGEPDQYVLTNQHGCQFSFPVFAGVLEVSSAWNPDVPDGDTISQTFTVEGASLGDPVVFGYSGDITGCQMTAFVSAADTVTVNLSNFSGALKELTGTLKLKVLK